MSYAKKDEDAEQAILKVDRTSVFQEGRFTTLAVSLLLNLTQLDCSTLRLYHRYDVEGF